MFSVLIKNTTVVDGSGNTPVTADIGITGNRISAIGSLGDVAEKIIDGTGMVTLPGIIDTSSQIDQDWSLFTDPTQERLIERGITTAIGGAHLISAAPIKNARTLATLATYSASGIINVDWQTTEEFLNKLTARPQGINFGTLLGGATLFLNAIDSKTADERITVLSALIYQGLSTGALGLSFSLSQTRKTRFSNEEIITFAKIAAEYNRPVILHLADYHTELLPALTQAIAISRSSGARIIVADFYIERHSVDLLERAQRMIRRAKEEGAPIYLQTLPWTTPTVPLLDTLPLWLRELPEDDILEQLETPASRDTLLRNLKNEELHTTDLIISEFKNSYGLEKASLARAAEIMHLDLEETLLELLHISRLRIKVDVPGLTPQQLVRIVHEENAFLTAASGLGKIEITEDNTKTTPFTLTTPGSGLISYAEFARKSSAIPAALFNIDRRGKIEKDYFADLVLLHTTSTTTPTVDTVLINGEVVLEGSAPTRTNAGIILRKTA